MTTGKEKNVFNIAVEGNFDDCQNLVKAMFADKYFADEIKMSGVNSINWARIIAQSVYYFYSYFLIEDNDNPINFSVPTGNFGDVYAGYLAKKIGLPINKFIVATNQNDILHRAISNGIYSIEDVSETISLGERKPKVSVANPGMIKSNAANAIAAPPPAEKADIPTCPGMYSFSDISQS